MINSNQYEISQNSTDYHTYIHMNVLQWYFVYREEFYENKNQKVINKSGRDDW